MPKMRVVNKQMCLYYRQHSMQDRSGFVQFRLVERCLALSAPEHLAAEVAPVLEVVRPVGQLVHGLSTGVDPDENDPTGHGAHAVPPEPAWQTAARGDSRWKCEAKASVCNTGCTCTGCWCWDGQSPSLNLVHSTHP